MVDLYLDPLTHDLAINDDGDFFLTKTTAQASIQQVKIELQTFKGEWFFNTLEGVPYHQELLIKDKSRASKTLADSILLNYINNIDIVEKVNRFDSSLDVFKRVYKLSFDFTDIYGETLTISTEL